MFWCYYVVHCSVAAKRRKDDDDNKSKTEYCRSRKRSFSFCSVNLVLWLCVCVPSSILSIVTFSSFPHFTSFYFSLIFCSDCALVAHSPCNHICRSRLHTICAPYISSLSIAHSWRVLINEMNETNRFDGVNEKARWLKVVVRSSAPGELCRRVADCSSNESRKRTGRALVLFKLIEAKKNKKNSNIFFSFSFLFLLLTWQRNTIKKEIKKQWKNRNQRSKK